MLSVVRNADLVLIVLEPGELRHDQIKQELHDVGIRVNESPPDIKVEKKGKGGINVSATTELDIDEETIRQVMKDNGYTNANVVIREEVDLDRFIDGLMDNRRYVPGVTVVNKSDTLESDERTELEGRYDLLVSAETGEHLEELRNLVFDRLELMRVYMKEKGEEADREEPLILESGSTVGEALESLPGDMKDRFKAARVTGESSDFPEQKVGLEHELMDEDVLELNLRHI